MGQTTASNKKWAYPLNLLTENKSACDIASMHDIQTPLLRKIDHYCQSAGIAPATFGNKVANDAALVGRIQAGTVSINMARHVDKWLFDNPPRRKPK